MFAVKYGLINILKKLINAGALINIDDYHKSGSPLIIASIEGNIDIVKILLENDADLDMLDFYEKDALYYAQKNGHGKIAKLLRNHKKC